MAGHHLGPVPERDPLELPCCTKLSGSSNLRILGESPHPETTERTPAPANLGPCSLLLKSEPADKEPPSGPPPRPLGLQALLCKELRDDSQPSDNAQPDAAVAARVPASPTANSASPATEALLPSRAPKTTAGPQQQQGWAEYAEPIKGELDIEDIGPPTEEVFTQDLEPASPLAPVPERDPLELPSCTTLTGSSNLRILGEDWAEYAEPINGELDIEDWEPPAEEDFTQEAAANGPLFLAPHILPKLQLGPHKSDSLAGSSAAHTVLVQQQLPGCTNCNQNLVSRDHVCKQILPKTQPFTCEECGAQFANMCNLHEHTKTHTGEGQDKTKVCGKEFNNSYHLIIHNRTHTQQRAFKCYACGKAFKDSPTLLEHTRTHRAEERPFKCNVCGKAFKASATLMRHTHTHTGERPCECKVCGKAFMHFGTLIKHMYSHRRKTIQM